MDHENQDPQSSSQNNRCLVRGDSSESNPIDLCTRPIKHFDKKFLNIIIKSAPLKIQKIARVLKNNNGDISSIKSFIPQIIIFVGEPGVGKSTLAQALAEYCRIACTFIKITDLYDKYKDSGSHNLREICGAIRKYSGPHIIILDEMQCLVKKRNYKEKEEEAARTLWSAIDEFEDYPNLLFIGTANKLKHLPPQLLSRISTSVFTLNFPSDGVRKEIINHYLSNIPVQIRHQLSEEEIDWLAKKTNGFSCRDMQKIIQQACTEISLNELDVLEENGIINLNIEHIKDAIKLVKQNKSRYTYWFSAVYKTIKPHTGLIVQITVPIVISSILNYYLQKAALQQQLLLSEIHHQQSMSLAVVHHLDSMHQGIQFQQQNLDQAKLFHKDNMDQTLKAQQENLNQMKEYNEKQLDLAKDNFQKSVYLN